MADENDEMREMSDGIEAEARSILHLEAPDGPFVFVQRFRANLEGREFDAAHAMLDPEFGDIDLERLDLTFLDDEGWGVAGNSRVTPDGDVIVRMIYMEGAARPVLITKPTEVEGVDFVLRGGPGAWSLFQIADHRRYGQHPPLLR